jgi:hypothetical protein
MSDGDPDGGVAGVGGDPGRGGLQFPDPVPGQVTDGNRGEASRWATRASVMSGWRTARRRCAGVTLRDKFDHCPVSWHLHPRLQPARPVTRIQPQRAAVAHRQDIGLTVAVEITSASHERDTAPAEPPPALPDARRRISPETGKVPAAGSPQLPLSRNGHRPPHHRRSPKFDRLHSELARHHQRRIHRDASAPQRRDMTVLAGATALQVLAAADHASAGAPAAAGAPWPNARRPNWQPRPPSSGPARACPRGQRAPPGFPAT